MSVYLYRRKRRRFSGSTIHLQQSNAAISCSGDDAQTSIFSVTDNPIFNNDQIIPGTTHLQSSYPLTITSAKIVKPPDYNEIDFNEQKSPPSYTEAMTPYSSM